MADPQQWGVSDVSDFLKRLNLDSLVLAFRTNAVNGKDLCELSDEDLASELHCTGLQVLVPHAEGCKGGRESTLCGVSARAECVLNV